MSLRPFSASSACSRTNRRRRPRSFYGFPDFASLVHAFVTSGVYIDLHTEIYPAGEIRGQLRFVPEPSSLLLAGIGLIGGAMRRRKRAVS